MVSSYNQTYDFDSFIVGDSNVDAYKMCLSLLEENKGRFVAVCGPSSSGKTHLVSAMKSAFQRKFPNKTALMCSYDEIISEYIEALQCKKQFDFQKRICEHDLLIVDNMQFAAGKAATQEELTCWFCAMLNEGKSVVIVLDRPVSCMEKLLEAMNEKGFGGCDVIEIKEADVSLRQAFLGELSKAYGIVLPDSIRNALIHSCPMRAAKGFLLKIQMMKMQIGRELTEQEMMECLSDYKYREA